MGVFFLTHTFSAGARHYQDWTGVVQMDANIPDLHGVCKMTFCYVHALRTGCAGKPECPSLKRRQ
jgi:hypothetical protein